MAKLVRAKRNGFWDGHRRRAGAVFPVADDAQESWFEDVGPAPAGTELPVQIKNAQAPTPKGFVQVMQEIAVSKERTESQAPQVPMTFAEAREYIDDGVSDLT
ncbi:MAG: hypothetical protein C0P74_014690 [Gammaproteobacteria bacterium]